jgi:hypothetical protein
MERRATHAERAGGLSRKGIEIIEPQILSF